MSKPSRPCNPGEQVILAGLPRQLFDSLWDAFVTGVDDDAEGTTVTVRIECSAAQQLSFVLATSIATNYEVSPDDA